MSNARESFLERVGVENLFVRALIYVDEEYRGMKDLLRGYAYSVRNHSFVKVLRDYD